MKTTPLIYQYDDYRSYLGDWIAHKRATGRFSARWFAKKAGFKAHNMLPLILAKKRNLGVASIPKFCHALGLNESQSHFFETLVLFNQAQTAKERVRFYDRLTRHPERRKIAPMEKSRLSFFRGWLAPVIYEMIQLPDFKPDAQWIADRIGEVSLSEVRSAIQDLVASGFVEASKKGKWTCNEMRLETGNNVRDVHLYAYHEQALVKAADALEALPAAMRHYRVITTAVPAGMLEELRALCAKFESDMLNRIENHKGPPADVIQLSLQIFPVLRTQPSTPLEKDNAKRR